MEVDGDGQVASFVIFAEEGGFSEVPACCAGYLSQRKMPEAEGLGTD